MFDILKVALPAREAHAALKQLLADKPDVILFDALTAEHLTCIGRLLENYASEKKSLFSVGSSGIEAALAAAWNKKRLAGTLAPPARQIVVGSGSCSPVTSGQIAWALKHGFAEVPLDTTALANARTATTEIRRATMAAVKLLQDNRSVIIHSTKGGANKRIVAKLKGRTAEVLGGALGQVLRGAVEQSYVRRICIAGGDTSSYAARAIGIEALEMVAALTPGAPLCRTIAPGSPVNGCEVVFKGGQVGAENYFEIVKRGVPISGSARSKD